MEGIFLQSDIGVELLLALTKIHLEKNKLW